MPAQARAFALALTAGVACALVYGALRRLRRAAKAGAWLTGLIDLLFWAIAALLTSLACALGDVAGLRLYMLLGVLCARCGRCFSPVCSLFIRSSSFRPVRYTICRGRKG